MNIHTNLTELIGHTPLFELRNIERAHNLQARLVAKVEAFNPAGSIKDRTAASMLAALEAQGKLNENTVIIEPTSGNTGVGLAALCAARGIRLVVVMPDSMSVERRLLISAYGAELMLTPGAEGVQGAIAAADKLAAETPGAVIAGQFVNPANPAAHYTTTGPEIWADTDGTVDILVVSAGTGGTLTGTSRYLREQSPNVRIVAVEPAGSPVLSKGYAGTHKIQGLGAGFIPDTLDPTAFDEIIDIEDEDAFAGGREMAATEGLLVGISSGAALAAALQVAERPENAGKLIVLILPDTGERYLSSEMFA